MYKKYIFIILFPLWAYSTNCPDTFIKIDAICYYKEHIDVLQDFIDINESLNGSFSQGKMEGSVNKFFTQEFSLC